MDGHIQADDDVRGEEELAVGQGALTQLRAYLAQRGLPPSARLPAERELSELLGVSRGDLRKALAVLEREGELWRHVGKGTFVGSRPAEEVSSIAGIANLTNPGEVMRTRLLLEPQIAGEAALHATAADIAALARCLERSVEAHSWRQYESWDNRLHRTIAVAAHNSLLLALFDTLNAVRRAVVWGRLRVDPAGPPANHHSFAEHQAIVAAIRDRDRDAAALAMRRHLATVQDKLMRVSEAAE